MWMTEGEALERVARTTANSAKNISQDNTQRRNQVVDLYGVEFYRQGDGGAPARFYLSISPDMVYMERFEFKLIIQPFISTVAAGGVQSATVTVDNTSLSVSGTTITPNPHKHTTQAHTHTITGGIAMSQTTAKDFRITIEGIDVTAYLTAQYDAWIDGEGVYPSLDVDKNYDILEVASDLIAEGRDSDADLLTRSGYKMVEISSNTPFSVVLVAYLKYSHLNR